MLIICFVFNFSLRNKTPNKDVKIIQPPVISGYKTVAGKFLAPISCKIYDIFHKIDDTVVNNSNLFIEKDLLCLCVWGVTKSNNRPHKMTRMKHIKNAKLCVSTGLNCVLI